MSEPIDPTRTPPSTNGSGPATGRSPHGPGTLSVHGRRARRPSHADHALTTPLIQTATYTFENSADLCAYMEDKMWGGAAARDRAEYGRYGNPTVRAVERRLAVLEGAEDAILFPTGMAAITNLLLTILPAGSHLILTDDCYRKTRHFCHTFLRRLGIRCTEVPLGDYDALEAAIEEDTRLILSESPTNPYLRVVDLQRLAAVAARHRRVKTIIDATFATPINVRPLEFGIDLVVHSATKYLAGHNDVMAGVVLGDAGLLHGVRQSQGTLGGVVDPHAAYLVERGLKTVALRVERQNETAQAVAAFLEEHPRVEQVWYPGLASHPDHDVARRQMRGFGGVVSFTVRPRAGEAPLEAGSRFVDAVEIPLIAPSLGGVESLIEQPALMSYYELSTAERNELGIRDNLVRLAVGIEERTDILADLARALQQV